MKCKYCNAEVQPNARFCTSCGGDLSKFDKCVSCGEFIDKGESTCPHCGTEQPQHVQPPKGNSKMWLWIIVAILLLGILGGGGYYFLSNKDKSPSFVQETDSIAEIGDSIISDIQSVEGIKSRLTDILSKALHMQDNDAVQSFFSKEYRKLYEKVEEIDNTVYEGEIGYWAGNIWDGGQEGNPDSFAINSVQNLSEKRASAQIKFIYDNEYLHTENLSSMELVFENGSWYIDDIGGNQKQSFEEYINSNKENSTIGNGTYTMIGKVSNYNIHMIIEINGSIVKGYYYYDSQGSGNTVQLSGSIKEKGELTLKKFSKDGEETGYFEGIFNGTEYNGKNVNYNRNEYLPFSVTVE